MVRAVTSSTSSSERARRRQRREALHPLLTLGVLALLAAAGVMLRDLSAMRGSVPIVAAAERPSGNWYLSYSRGSLDHAVLFRDLSGAARAMKEADVLFLGDSGAMFAFKHDLLAEFSARTGLRCFVLAFAYNERKAFAEALIRKHDLRP